MYANIFLSLIIFKPKLSVNYWVIRQLQIYISNTSIILKKKLIN